MHSHIQYVTQQLSRVREKPLDGDVAIALRSMRALLLNGLRNANDRIERLNRLSLVVEIDRQLKKNLH